ncbi:substrate-binding domain-containing protein [Anabaena azotica]|uniref:Helix-turn-helix domain-containing protein n=1 Tax=Anabaena azotica FACHB-119 TaxID=947527 RepID=A0ABR8CZN2_9NOST|nr:substrate-binding domain-containing protein [Anabaena azotica]MBD2499537.1 helix-turn-helix domain-containing protein [Anabaena azotica FACHB-119]
MKQDSNLRNNLKSIRTRLGMSQQDLANIASVTRQTISGVESGQYAPSVAIALRLAKALGCQVEDLFWQDQDLPQIEAILAKPVPPSQSVRLSLARVGGQWIAYPLLGKDAFRQDMIPADAEGASQTGEGKVSLRLLDDNLEALHNTVVIAGCAPVIALWARATERWHPQLRVHFTFANSISALQSLCAGKAHIAGMHLYDPKTGEHNLPFAREILAGREAVLITLGLWEEGLLVPSGNPKGFKTLSDIVEAQATIVNREVGAGSRMLLEQKLQQEQIPFQAVKGFEQIVTSHQDVAQAIAFGLVDAGISTASVAATFGLGFVPLHQSRYDLVILKEYLEEAPIQQLLSTLGHRMVHSQLEVLGGYDISKIGEVVATI